VQVRYVGGTEQRPLTVLHHTFHEQVRNPVRRVHVVSTAPVVAGVLAQLEKLFDVQVPGFEIGTHRPSALSPLVDRHRGVIHDLEERHDSLGLAVGPLYVGTQGPYRGPVVAESSGILGKQRVFLDRLVDPVQVVRNRREIAR